MKKINLHQINLIYPNDLWDTLHNKKNLIIKIGCDPTSPDLHIGHLVIMQVLKYLQDLGHKIFFIIGDFTASIGDPTGRNQSRPISNIDKIKENANTYFEQVFKILDKDKTQVGYNSQWLEKSSSFLMQLMSKFTVSQIIQRNDFQQRIQKGIPVFLHETVYPLLQGLDSVIIDADIEIGGTDQLFNMFFGRSMQKTYNKPMQGIIACNLIPGIDGSDKMSKSIGNTINFNTPPIDIFNKIMSISDKTMDTYYLNIFNHKCNGIGKQAKQDKIMLAYRLVELLYSKNIADINLLKYNSNYIQEYTLQGDKNITIIDAMEKILLVSRSNCKRLIDQKSVRINNVLVIDYNYKLNSTCKIKIGKKFNKIVKINNNES